LGLKSKVNKLHVNPKIIHYSYLHTSLILCVWLMMIPPLPSAKTTEGPRVTSTSTITIWKILVTMAHFHVLLLLQRRRRRRTTMTSIGDHRTARIRPCVVARDSAAAFCPPGIRPLLLSTVGRARRTWSRRQWRASVPFGLHFPAMKGSLVLR
jgi:hypothetical protein